MFEAQLYYESLKKPDRAHGCFLFEALYDSEANRDKIDAMLIDYAASFTEKELPENSTLQCNPDVVVDLFSKILPRASPINCRKRYYPESFQDVIDFSSDLKLVSSTIQPPPAPAPTPIPAPAPTPSTSAFPTFKSSAQRPVDLTTSGGPAPALPSRAPLAEQPRNQPFKSARDQFVQDGGKFPAQQKTNASSASTQMTRAALNQGGGKSEPEQLPAELEHLDRLLVEKIEHEIIFRGSPTTFDDIAGLEAAKRCVIELICWPITAPHLFQGLRKLPRGCLLFGPPGTGKTLIGKAIASQAGATFFCISASSLMSKWIGEGEKTVRTLFEVATYRQPSVIFLDEVDSLLCQRSSEENEGTRRMKTEFLVQLDGAGTQDCAQVVVVGATNRPEELDEAARRRFVKRIYIPLPDIAGRTQLFTVLLGKIRHGLNGGDLDWLVRATDGYSGADVSNLCQEAAMGPMREVARQRNGDLRNVQERDISPVSRCHFEAAMRNVGSSVSPGELDRYIAWDKQFGAQYEK